MLKKGTKGVSENNFPLLMRHIICFMYFCKAKIVNK